MPFVSAVIVSAGNSTRMKSDKSKQLLLLNGKPVIYHTLAAFEKNSYINEIIVVCRECDRESISNIIKNTEFKKIKALVSGGSTRSQSVLNGINAACANAQFYAIHDGARPLITDGEISATVERAFKTGAAAVGVPVTDTIKIIDVKTGQIKATPERSELFSIRTPQVFSAELYKSAVKFAGDSAKDFTDDCKLIENYGESVYTVVGEYSNIKITTPEDLQIARAIMKEGDI